MDAIVLILEREDPKSCLVMEKYLKGDDKKYSEDKFFIFYMQKLLPTWARDAVSRLSKLVPQLEGAGDLCAVLKMFTYVINLANRADPIPIVELHSIDSLLAIMRVFLPNDWRSSCDVFKTEGFKRLLVALSGMRFVVDGEDMAFDKSILARLTDMVMVDADGEERFVFILDDADLILVKAGRYYTNDTNFMTSDTPFPEPMRRNIGDGCARVQAMARQAAGGSAAAGLA